MTAKEKQKVSAAIARQLQAAGFMRLNQVPRLFDQEGIDRGLYAGSGLKRWLGENFPEFRIEGSNGLETVHPVKMSGVDALLAAGEALEEELEGGRVLLSSIPRLLEERGILYRELSQGQKMIDWLTASFPQFAVTDDNLWLEKKESQTNTSSPAADPALAEVQQMHGLAFMNWWSNNLKRLKTFREDLPSENQIKAQVARRMGRALLGEEGLLTIQTEEPRRAALDIGLESASQSPIYAIFEENPKNTDGTKQPWALVDFVAADQPTELGEWVRMHCAAGQGGYSAYAALAEQAGQVGQLCRELEPALEAYLACLQAGRLPAASLAGRMKELEAAADQLRQTYQAAWNEPLADDATLEQILERADSKNALLQQLHTAVEQFEALAVQADQHLQSYKLPLPEDGLSVPLRDAAQLRSQWEELASEEQMAAFIDSFRQLLTAYRAMRQVMQASQLTPEVDKCIEELLSHFHQITYKVAVLCMVNAEPESYGYLDQLEPIGQLLEECAGSVRQAAAAGSGAELSPAQLLDLCLAGKADGMLLADQARQICPDDELLQMLVFGRLDQLPGYFQAHPDHPANTPDLAQRIARLPADLTCCAAARRLWEIVGNRDRLAEIYYTMGLICDGARAAKGLLEIYRQQQDTDAFEKVYRHFGAECDGGIENQIFYLGILCQRSPQQALEYARDNYCLLYLPQSLELLLGLPADCLEQEERERLAVRRQTFAADAPRNQLESALIAGDLQGARQLAERPDELAAMGYTEREIQRIAQAAESESSQSAAGLPADYAVGLRLYRFQRNLHGLAEGYMWQGLAQDRSIVATHLLLVLADEKRWQECCQLYEHFQSLYAENTSCRKLYLVALLQGGMAAAPAYIRANLQDCLSLVNTEAIVRASLQQAAGRPGALGEFCTELLQLAGCLDDPLVRGVVLLDRTLREYASPLYAKEIGLPDQLANAIGSVYQSDNYPHGATAVDIARRCMRFFGTYKGVAEAFARFAQPDAAADECLWDIYQAMGEESLQIELLQGSEALRTKHREQYLSMLFRRGRYAAFLQACGQEQLDGPGQLQAFIARLQLDAADPRPLPGLSDFAGRQQADDWFRQWGGLLTASLLAAGRIADVGRVLENFEGWLDSFTADELRQVVTGGGAASQADLAALQQEALQGGQLSLALYIYNVLGVGQLQELSDQYAQGENAALEQSDDAGKLAILGRLRLLYDGRLPAVSVQLSLLRVRQLEADDTLSDSQKAAAVGKIIADYPPDPAAVAQLLPLLEQQSLGGDAAVYTPLADLAGRMEQPGQIVAYFQQRLEVWGVQQQEFALFVLRFWVSVFAEGRFDPALVEPAARLCARCVEKYRSAESILCLYFAEKARGRQRYADYALRVLADVSNDITGKVLDEIIYTQLQDRWQDSLPGYLDLFKQVLSDCTVEEIDEYIRFAGILAVADAGELVQLQASLAEGEPRMLSEQNSGAVVNMLFAWPQNAQVWQQCTRLPLQDVPESYAKLLYLASRAGAGVWRECAEYCEKYQQYDLLLQTLGGWAASSEPGQSTECRKFLEERLTDQPDYFARWAGSEALLHISQSLCDRVQLAEQEFHATLRAVTLIAVKTGFDQAVEHLLDRFGNALLTGGSNIGVVLAVRLLLEGRWQQARDVLALLGSAIVKMNYSQLIVSLSGKTPEELAQWAQATENRITLELVLPDGNRPSLEQINAVAYNGIRAGQQKETAAVLFQMLAVFPNDHGICNALYDLCCTRFEGYLPLLHRTLRELVAVRPGVNAASYYRRDQKQYARMLAVLDALLISNSQTSQAPDYDFTRSTGEYYRANAGGVSPRDVSDVTAAYNDVRSALQNRSPDEVRRLSEGYLALLTSNWLPLLRQAWERQEQPGRELQCTVQDLEDLGFGRSALRLLVALPADQRTAFVQWLSAWGGGSLLPLRRRQQAAFVAEFYAAGWLDKLEQQMGSEKLAALLADPFEDYSLCDFLIRRHLDEAIAQNLPSVYPLAWMMGAMTCHQGFTNELAKRAEAVFTRTDDSLAYLLYGALCRVVRDFDLKPVQLTYRVDNRKQLAIYETMHRLAGLFAGDSQQLAEAASGQLPVWDCLNLVLELLSTSRSDEVLRLASLLSRDNARLVRAVLFIMDDSGSDQEKMELVDEFADDVTRLYFCYVLKYPYNPFRPKGAIKISYCLQNLDMADQVNRRYMQLVKTLAACNSDAIVDGRALLAHTILISNRCKEGARVPQKDPSLWSGRQRPGAEDDPAGHLPAYAEGLEPLAGVDPAALEEQHRAIQALASNLRRKRELSQRIYQASLTGGYRPQIEDALLLFGVDHYNLCLAEKDREAATETLFELATMLKGGAGEGYGAREARQAMPAALFDLLISFSSLQPLLDSYGSHRGLWQFMRGLLADPLQAACVGQIYQVLENLCSSYSYNGQENLEALRQALSDNYFALEKIETNRWMELKNRVQKLINDEINELDHRPVLDVQVFNKGLQDSEGHLYGMVTNIGQAAAEEVALQASYSNNTRSSQYLVRRILPGAQVVFEVDYSAGDAQQLDYFLNLAFQYNGKVSSQLARKGQLEIAPMPAPTYPDNILCSNANGIDFAVDPKTGEIYSPEFIGRKQETAALRGLVEGSSFAQYKSALLYGVRRTGKTTLLNYFATYITENCPDVICVKTDCQTLSAADCIQYVFVDRVIDIVQRQLPDLALSDGWERLRQTWSSGAFCADQHPERLSLFYYDVKQLIGDRGLYLVIDEVDRLFQRVEENHNLYQRNLDSLFGAISEMLNSTECRQCVHFVLCGSNWLIRYNLKGDKVNQLFQRFGKQVIEIGKLPEEDAKALIRTPYRAYPELVITASAMDWIWGYVGGLAWHTKLLGEEAIKRAKQDYRSVVYPSDVQQSLPKVVNEQWCKQFYEGCEGRTEYQLLDAMQSLASKREGYVHLNSLCQRLGWEPVEVQKAMVVLRELKVVAQHPADQKLFRFELDIYRRFFRTCPSQFEQMPEEPDIFQKKQDLSTAAAPAAQPVSAAPIAPAAPAVQPAAGLSSDEEEWDPFSDT